jgi:single-stranded DNA-specific DHH superfamily exonuclease
MLRKNPKVSVRIWAYRRAAPECGGRLDDAGTGIDCLLADDAATATQIAAKLDALNRERRGIEAGMQDSALAALEQIDARDNFSLARSTKLASGRNPSVLASPQDKFHRPVIASREPKVAIQIAMVN